jgi:hypothetical protein
MKESKQVLEALEIAAAAKKLSRRVAGGSNDGLGPH